MNVPVLRIEIDIYIDIMHQSLSHRSIEQCSKEQALWPKSSVLTKMPQDFLFASVQSGKVGIH